MTIRELIALRAPQLREPYFADDDVALGTGGLGLDSIAIAEVLLDCERYFGVRVTDLLDGAPITVARIAARLDQVTAS
jgi:acyl carrier protein